MSETLVWVGIDVGERASVVCRIDSDDHVARSVVDGDRTAQVVDALATAQGEHIVCVAIESSAGHRLPRELATLGYPVVTIDPARAKKFLSIRSVKSDKNDALGLAEVARYGATAKLAVHIKNLTSEQLRVRLRLRDQIVRQKGAARSSLRDHLRTLNTDVRVLPPPTKLRAFVEAEISTFEARGVGEMVPDILALLEVVEALSQCVYQMDKRLEAIAKKLLVTRRLLAVPGVGPIVALSFYSAIEDPFRFARSEDVGAYLGLTPSLKQSGNTARNGRITKRGNKLTRSHLVMSAGVILGRAAMRSALGDWAQELKARIGWGKARVALARKLAVIMLTIWKKEQAFAPYPN